MSHASTPSHGPARFASRYQLCEPLARGGMGVVYRAVEASTGEQRAIKRVSIANDNRAQTLLAAFEREYKRSRAWIMRASSASTNTESTLKVPTTRPNSSMRRRRW